MLSTLSDDELARYGEIARDQAAAELTRWWLQVLLMIGAAVSFAVGIDRLVGERHGNASGGGSHMIAVALTAGLVLAYSPYRRLRNWTLWRRHCKAVSSEQERRTGALATGVKLDVAR